MAKQLLKKYIFDPTLSKINTTRSRRKSKQRNFSYSKVYVKLEQLPSRSVLKIEGFDAFQFLQRVITNDLTRMSIVESLYVFFLNPGGKIIADGLLHPSKESNTYYLDLDSKITPILENHFEKYFYHQNVIIKNLEAKLNVWQIISSTKLPLRSSLLMYQDPRHPKLGSRILAPTDIGSYQILQKLDLISSPTRTPYKEIRFRLGIPEGTNEIPLEELYPLEVNADYLEALHFKKGEYVGADVCIDQYLQDTPNFRIVPIVFGSGMKNINLGDSIQMAGSKVGTVRGVLDHYGIALLRTDVLYSTDLTVRGVTVTAWKPDWWPLVLTNEISEIPRKIPSPEDCKEILFHQNVY